MLFKEFIWLYGGLFSRDTDNLISIPVEMEFVLFFTLLYVVVNII